MLLIEGGEEGGTKDSQPWGWEPRDDSCHQGFVYQASLPQALDQIETANSISPGFSSSILPSSSWPAQHSCWVTPCSGTTRISWSLSLLGKGKLTIWMGGKEEKLRKNFYKSAGSQQPMNQDHIQ